MVPPFISSFRIRPISHCCRGSSMKLKVSPYLKHWTKVSVVFVFQYILFLVPGMYFNPFTAQVLWCFSSVFMKCRAVYPNSHSCSIKLKPPIWHITWCQLLSIKLIEAHDKVLILFMLCMRTVEWIWRLLKCENDWGVPHQQHLLLSSPDNDSNNAKPTFSVNV